MVMFLTIMVVASAVAAIVAWGVAVVAYRDAMRRAASFSGGRRPSTAGLIAWPFAARFAEGPGTEATRANRALVAFILALTFAAAFVSLRANFAFLSFLPPRA